MTARDVPAFPEEDPKLTQLKNWPKKRVMEGWDCELRVRTSIIDTSEPPPRPGLNQTTSAYYLCRPHWWPWGRPQMLGPHYNWGSNGQLLERGYAYGGRSWVVYQIDRAGRLAGFEDSKHGVTEYFDADGVLIAGEYAPVNLDWRAEGYRGGTVSVWLGERITHEDFVKRRVQLFQDTASRY